MACFTELNKFKTYVNVQDYRIKGLMNAIGFISAMGLDLNNTIKWLGRWDWKISYLYYNVIVWCELLYIFTVNTGSVGPHVN